MSNCKPCVSVVVPVYNVEPYLAECVDSVLGQTFGDLEVILVDDGSTDGCPALCDDYAARDGRVRVIHKPNGGLSDARNAGIEASEADILSFVDADDLIHPQMLEALVSPLVGSSEVGCSVCTYQRFSSRGQLALRGSYDITPTCVTSVRALEIIYSNQTPNLGFVTWNKAYRRRLFDEGEVRFPVGRIHEDDFTTYRLLYAAREVAMVKRPLYGYRVREGSIMSSSADTARGLRDAIDASRGAYRFFSDKERTLAASSAKVLMRTCMRAWDAAPDDVRGQELRSQAMAVYRQTWAEGKPLLRGEGAKAAAYGLFPAFPRLAVQVFRAASDRPRLR